MDSHVPSEISIDRIINKMKFHRFRIDSIGFGGFFSIRADRFFSSTFSCTSHRSFVFARIKAIKIQFRIFECGFSPKQRDFLVDDVPDLTMTLRLIDRCDERAFSWAIDIRPSNGFDDDFASVGQR